MNLHRETLLLAAEIADQQPDTLQSVGQAGSGQFRAVSQVAAKLRALAAQQPESSRDTVLEEAAMVCDARGKWWRSRRASEGINETWCATEAEFCAIEIRALKSNAGRQESRDGPSKSSATPASADLSCSPAPDAAPPK